MDKQPLLQVLLKVPGDFLVQMYTVAACYVVLVARVDKQVGISAGIYTGFHKRQGVLWHAGIVMILWYLRLIQSWSYNARCTS